jgi:hypothetical protein
VVILRVLIPTEPAMRLFKTELLQEPPRVVVTSYAKPAFGRRYDRRASARFAPPPTIVARATRNFDGPAANDVSDSDSNFDHAA